MLTMTSDRSRRRPEPATSGKDQGDLKARVEAILGRRAAVGLALGVVRNGELEFFHGHGVADIESGRPVTEDTAFRVASITKTFTAIAVMQLWEEGRIDLDAPANDVLRAFRLTPASPSFPPATIRHLLTHTAGIPEVLHPVDLLRPDWGDSVLPGAPIPTLAAYYGSEIRLEWEPGTTFVYTNHGFAALQQIVEDVSGMPFDRYLRERVLEPLGMTDSDVVRARLVARNLATGYVLGPQGPRRVTDRAWVTTGASSLVSTTRDMARYVAALVGGGANAHGSILKPSTLALMFEPHFQPDPRVPGMGLGFDRNEAGGHRVIGHGGILPGFNSQLFVAPDDGVGVIAFTTGTSLAMLWLPTELAGLLDHLLGVPLDEIRTDLPQRPETWAGICGTYRLPGPLTNVRARLMFGAGVQVFVRGGRLMLRELTPIPALLKGLPLHPDDPTDPDVFRIDLRQFGLPTARVVFSREGGQATAVHVDLFPMSLRRQRPVAQRRPRSSAPVADLLAMTARALDGRRTAARRSSAGAGRASAAG